MTNYYIIFSNEGRDICGTWERAESPEEAQDAAAWRLLCRFPNVDFDAVRVAE